MNGFPDGPNAFGPSAEDGRNVFDPQGEAVAQTFFEFLQTYVAFNNTL